MKESYVQEQVIDEKIEPSHIEEVVEE